MIVEIGIIAIVLTALLFLIKAMWGLLKKLFIVAIIIAIVVFIVSCASLAENAIERKYESMKNHTECPTIKYICNHHNMTMTESDDTNSTKYDCKFKYVEPHDTYDGTPNNDSYSNKTDHSWHGIDIGMVINDHLHLDEEMECEFERTIIFIHENMDTFKEHAFYALKFVVYFIRNSCVHATKIIIDAAKDYI